MVTTIAQIIYRKQCPQGGLEQVSPPPALIKPDSRLEKRQFGKRFYTRDKERARRRAARHRDQAKCLKSC
jgi:hypothetical protein